MRRTSLLLALIVFCAGAVAQPAPHTFALDAPAPLGRHTGYFVALQNGWYRDAGIDLRIVPGRGSADGVNRVASGEVSFAFGDAGALALARAKGVRVKMLAIVYARSPFVVFSLSGTPIASPKDLEGRSIAAPPTDGMRTMFPVFARLTGIDAGKVRCVDIPIEKKDGALLSREVDAMTSGLQQQPTLARAAAQRNLRVQALRWSDFGFELYSNGLLANDALIEANPALVRGFVQASLRGLATAFADPAAAAALMVKRHPNLDPGVVQAEIEIIREVAMSEAAKRNGLGWVDGATMQRTVDAVSEVFNSPRVPVDSLYTNAFIK